MTELWSGNASPIESWLWHSYVMSGVTLVWVHQKHSSKQTAGCWVAWPCCQKEALTNTTPQRTASEVCWRAFKLDLAWFLTMFYGLISQGLHCLRQMVQHLSDADIVRHSTRIVWFTLSSMEVGVLWCWVQWHATELPFLPKSMEIWMELVTLTFWRTVLFLLLIFWVLVIHFGSKMMVLLATDHDLLLNGKLKTT